MKVRKIVSFFAAAAVLSGTFATAEAVSVETTYPFGTLQRQMESLDRGLVAMQTNGGIYLSWRLFGNEDTRLGAGSNEVTFEIYRNGELIDTEENTTNYLDPNGTLASEYYVVSSNGDTSETVSAFSSGSNYFDIPLDKPDDVTLADGNTYSYSPNDASVGDLDGDGEYEIILKWDCHGQDNSKSGYTGNVLIDAYKLNGTKLWRLDLGPNIRAGAHYTQFLVYDFDGDGGAEIAIKTAPGSKDGNGTYVNTVSLNPDVSSGDNTESYVVDGGFITSGPEYYSVFDGNGAVLDTVAYPFPRDHSNNWGKWGDYTNRVDRFLGAVAFLDGVHPSIITLRGYYGKTTVAAYTLEDGRLKIGKTFNVESGTQYSGQGNHNITVADVDGDGKDEIITGALAFDDDLSVLWCSGRGHGDALHIGAYDPTREGYVYFSVHEDGGHISNGKSLDYGMTLYDAKTGEELLHTGNNADTGRGMMANVGSGGYFQFWGAGTYMSKGNDNYAATSINGTSSNFRIFWDGDLYDELMDGRENSALNVTSWDGSKMTNIFTTQGCTSINSTKANPSLTADILGDWREEIIMRRSDSEALRVYVSDIPTEYKIMTLMHDSMYRSGVAAEQTAYNQPPHVGFYMGHTVFYGPVTELTIDSYPEKLTYNVGESFETKGLTVSAVYENGKETSITEYILDGYNPNAAGTQTITISYGGQSQSFNVTVESGFEIDENGIITGYSGDSKSVILPESIDGVNVKGFADGSMKGSKVTNLYIYDDAITFDGDVFDRTTNIHAYKDSTAQAYCDKMGIPFISMIAEPNYVACEDYEGDEFGKYAGSFNDDTHLYTGGYIVKNYIRYGVQGGGEETINGIKYGSGSSGNMIDNLTGIQVGKDGNNTYLVPSAGKFSTNGRNAWLEIEEKVDLSAVSEYTFQFDVLYPTDCGTLVLTASDGSKTFEPLTMTGDMETDKWYTYTYHYDSDNHLTLTISEGVNIIDEKDLGVVSSTYGIYRIDFTKGDNALNPSNISDGMLACMDNIKVYVPERTVAEFAVTDSYDLPIKGAVVTMSGMSAITNEKGIAEIDTESGAYSATVTADGYYQEEVDLTLTGERMSVPVQLTSAPITAKTIAFADSSVTLAAGGYKFIKYSVTPESADYGITFESSNNSVAAVDANGIIKGIAPGTAKITASRDGVSAECTVNVISSSDGVPAKIVLNGDNNYSPNTLTSDNGIINVTASVYDKNGIELYDAPVTFTYTGADEAEEYYNSIKIVPDGESDVTVTASIGSVSQTKKITLVKTSAAKYVSASFDGTLKLVQSAVAQSQKLEGTGITLNVGNRNGSGDGYTGFVMEGGVLKAQAGKWNTSSRNAYITFDDAPAAGNNEFMFETKLTFNKGNEATVKISDGTKEVVTLSPSVSGLSAGVEYQYRIMYEGRVYTQYITDMSTGETVSNVLNTSAGKISRIDITGAADVNSSVTFDDMRLFTAEDGMTAKAIVYVYDEDGNSIEGALVETATGTALTAANGRASIDCYTGTNTFKVSYNGMSAVKTLKIREDNSIINVKLLSSFFKLIYDDSPVYLLQNTDYAVRFIRGEYNGGRLTDAKIVDVPSSNGQTLINLSSDSEEYKVFIWDYNMMPRMKPFEK